MNKRDTVLHAKLLAPLDNPEKLVAFIEFYLDGYAPKEAWVRAGYSEGQSRQAMHKLRTNWRLVDKMIDERIGSHAPLALNVVVDLMKNAKSETVRLNAAKDILSRAGKDKPVQITHSTKEPEDLPDEELDAEIIALADRLNIAKS